ncbi:MULTISPECIES: triose-phosphate isomerase family protein [unclassified Streptomyces]|uniref:triose-phosphate isomerase family protein n=1 Tax=unclassified Streptomyces TaxID=2593676 RepID=UPI002252E35A|nr:MULTISPECIES: triose-phosphate isomerase family protein [unclassified Streptomyces]WSP55697.1 triose-phosphate isomerase [Streptomyces sp. NBC_01241]WSU23566.1 triose-phosphate isomerase [Streptomyces sp. NBC_01108]MCX4787396.1 triose-phosphate isomerase [Streptomyces sp. NBC_01221]MCX4796819.1 triose-phosphate isomerase [Streptomyces sp. NBC_01242]WSJ38035.1 triose-phosphate isomerase [Streptomyces sp. NBC_01321]
MPAAPQNHPRVTIGVSLKMYFGHHETLNWARRIADTAAHHPAVTSGTAELFVLPAFPAIVPVAGILAGTGVRTGAQDLATEDTGPYTGEVSGTHLKEIGASYAEVGHAERRRLFGEGDTVVAAKTAAALRNGLTPVLCVGELDPVAPAEAAARTVAEAARILATAAHDGAPAPVVIAYEPQWAIGAPEPASPEHIRTVCEALTAWLATGPALTGSRVIYGGSAGPGLLTELGTGVGGLFLGRFAHDPAAVERILDEAMALHAPATAPAAAHSVEGAARWPTD